jgi:hypothetical protein
MTGQAGLSGFLLSFPLPGRKWEIPIRLTAEFFYIIKEIAQGSKLKAQSSQAIRLKG